MTANARDPQGAADHEPQCGGQHNPGDRHIVRYLCGACGYTEDTEYIRAEPPSGLTPPSGGATAPDPGEVIQAMRDATAALVCIGAHAQAGPHTLGCRCGCAVCERRDDAHRLAVRWLLARLDAHRA